MAQDESREQPFSAEPQDSEPSGGAAEQNIYELLAHLDSPPLALFCSEAHLDSVFEAIDRNPSALLGAEGAIAGGMRARTINGLHIAQECQASYPDEPQYALRLAHALNLAFNVGFSVVERVTDYRQGDNSGEAVAIARQYKTWRTERTYGQRETEILNFLALEQALPLAWEVLGDGRIASLLNVLPIETEYKNGKERFVLRGDNDRGTRWRREGVLAAFYLVREHRIERACAISTPEDFAA